MFFRTDEGLTLETSELHIKPHIRKKLPYQSLLIKPVSSLLANSEKIKFFQNYSSSV